MAHTGLVIMHIIAAMLVLNIFITQPSITGFVIAGEDNLFEVSTPVKLAVIFIIAVLGVDIYVYHKEHRKNFPHK